MDEPFGRRRKNSQKPGLFRTSERVREDTVACIERPRGAFYIVPFFFTIVRWYNLERES